MSKRGFLILIWVLALAPAAAFALLYGSLPDQVPLQWGLDGTVRCGGKGELLLMLLLSPLLAALLLGLPKLDPRRKNYARFQRHYDVMCVAILLFLAGIDGVVLTEALRPGAVTVWRLVAVGVGLLLAVLGNLMPKVKSNFFVGIKTPWTLSDPDVWNRANRLGGILFFALGLTLAFAGLLLPELVVLAVLLAGLPAAAGLPILLSYIWYRQKVDREGGE